MNLETRILMQNPCYHTGGTITPQGIMVHSLGVAQPDPEVFARVWNQPDARFCPHAIVGADKVLQVLPWNHRARHCGKGIKDGDTHLSLALCEPAGHTYQGRRMVGYDAQKNAEFFDRVYHNAVELSAQLCRRYQLDPTQILCHSESQRFGIASRHPDVMHWFPAHGKNMDLFRQDVARTLKGEADRIEKEVQKIVEKVLEEQKHLVWDKLEDVPDWGRDTVETLTDRGLLCGNETGLGLTHDLLRTLVMNDCAGLYRV